MAGLVSSMSVRSGSAWVEISMTGAVAATVDLVKSLREIEAAFFADIYIDQCYVGSQLLDGPERVGIR